MSEVKDISGAAGGRVQLPPFWHKRPKAWFMLADTEFSLNNITDQRVMFKHVLVALPEDYIDDVVDIDPTGLTPYDQLKTAILKRLTPSNRDTLHILFQDMQLGSDKPSTLLKRMRSILGDKQMDPELFKELWVQKLPVAIQSILASCVKLSLDELSETADNIADVVPMENKSIHQINTDIVGNQKKQTPQNSSESEDTISMTALYREVMHIKSRLDNYGADNRRRRSRSRSRPRFRQRSRSGARLSYCFYHQKYGQHARKCTQPCAFHSNPNIKQSRNGNARM